MRFSLIVGTVERPAELEGLLESLAAQTCRDFEVIVADQGAGEGMAALCRRFAERIDLRRLPMRERGLSRARNAALREASGDVLAFPDDDCVYPPHLLMQVGFRLAAWPIFPCSWRVGPIARLAAVACLSTTARRG